ncbi:hypothetical protein [Variovorax sp. J31P207]|uniref:hypothetical protein n=1 Tax=Variovorax sp. J31P207 TaxID=3053510 RepID=UPI0025763608|nr:hypothetical protein [Variovorax sp. J31P207]MDM0068496.1 hypothetical protein [Variovorax sp. J31P207]
MKGQNELPIGEDVLAHAIAVGAAGASDATPAGAAAQGAPPWPPMIGASVETLRKHSAASARASSRDPHTLNTKLSRTVRTPAKRRRAGREKLHIGNELSINRPNSKFDW